MSDTWVSDLAGLAAPLGEGSPCGDSVEYEVEYLALEEEIQGRPEVEYGDTLTQAIAPDWRQVKRLALPLAMRSRDLRLAVYLARAELNLNGVRGFAAGLTLIETLLTEQWAHLHPQLDADDDHDPQLRINILASLCEAAGLLHELRAMPLASFPALGSVSLRDLELSSGEVAGAVDQEKPSLAMIEAVFQEAASTDALDTTLAALEQAYECSVRIEMSLTERVGVGSAIDLGELSALLHRACEAVRQRLPNRVPNPTLASAPQTATVAAGRGEIGSRDDVRHTLDRLCAYFAVHEPTSPVPLLLQRARKLLDLSFMDLLHDLAPNGVAQMALVSGIRHTEQRDD